MVDSASLHARFGLSRHPPVRFFLMKRHDIHYGDTIFVQGVGEYDGEWRVEDTMNRKFAGQDKIDLLVPNHIRYGKWTNVSVYKQVASVKKQEKDWWQKLIEIFGL